MTKKATPTGEPVRTPRIDVGAIRRQQIVEAAVAIIAEQGLQNLTLSLIEKRARMSRGQLTYYFPAKEDILLAVFDRLVELMYQRMRDREERAGKPAFEVSVWTWIGSFLEGMLLKPPVSPEFHCLQYTFLSQIGHRSDFRQRLARLYEDWRSRMALGLEAELHEPRPSSTRAMASLIQAIFHGLGMQLAADPKAFDRQEMLELCTKVLGKYFQSNHRPGPKVRRPLAGTNGVSHKPGVHPLPRLRSPRKSKVKS